MSPFRTSKTVRRFIKYGLALLLLVFLLFLILVNRYLEPVLQNRLHTLIIQGSDSLYQYQLGKLKANLFGGDVEVENLHIWVDSSRYRVQEQRGILPPLTMELHLVSGHIKGVALLPLLFGKKVMVKEIISKDADVKLARHIRNTYDTTVADIPIWKAIRPSIKSIKVGKINLDGIKLLYKDVDTAESVKLQFDRCVAMFRDIKIDSVSATDTTRIGFTKSIAMRFEDLKFRTPDSMYKMKAKLITYSSDDRSLQVKEFKLQPTLEEDAFYKVVGVQRSRYTVLFDDVRFKNFQLERFIHNNEIAADSVLFHNPDVVIYNDRTYPQDMESKIGKSPQQQLLKANTVFAIKGIAVQNVNLTYTEKNDKTLQEGILTLRDMQLTIANVTNSPKLIAQNPICTAHMQGHILNSSPITATFTFYLDSLDGRFDASGTVKDVSAEQLNELAVPLASIKLQSFDMHQLDFAISGDDFSAGGKVHMLYDDLSVLLQKTNEETGNTKTKKFLTKIVNKFTLWSSNPEDGVLRTADHVLVARISSKSFFGLVWNAIFSGMQDIMTRSFRYQ